MALPRVFVTRHLPGDALEFLAKHCEVAVWPGELPPTAGELAREVGGCDGILTLLTDRVDEPLHL